MSGAESMCVSTCPLDAHRVHPHPGASHPCRADLCQRTATAGEAIRLTRLGARASLVTHLTGLEKTVANRLYRQLHGKPSPPGQMPFTDAWYLREDRRMLHATLAWRLSQRLATQDLSPARRLIEVYESYRWLVPHPLLDITRVAFVPQLVAMQDWQAHTCAGCGSEYLAPTGSLGATCWACRLHRRYRCRQCGEPLPAQTKGRYRQLCQACQRARQRPSMGTWP